MAIYNFNNYEKVILRRPGQPDVELEAIEFNGVIVWQANLIDTSITTIEITGTYISGNWFGLKLNYSGTLPTVTIDWGDGTETVASYFGSHITHQYAANQPYTIKISSTSPFYIEYIRYSAVDDGSCLKVSSIIFGDNISQIGVIGADTTFGCDNLTYVYIGKNITSIPSGCFKGLTYLATVDIDENSALTTINTEAFSGCTALSKIWLPATVTSMPNSFGFAMMAPFYGCSASMIIYLAGTVQPGFHQYWNNYSSSGKLAYYENTSYEDYKNL
jgi:hypothetical protein